TGWTRYTCTVSTAGSHSGTPYIYIKQTDGVVHTWYVDAVQLEDNATARPFQDGITHINTTIDSPTVFKNQSDSTTALQITNAAGTALVTADTLNSKMIVGGTLQIGNAA